MIICIPVAMLSFNLVLRSNASSLTDCWFSSQLRKIFAGLNVSTLFQVIQHKRKSLQCSKIFRLLHPSTIWWSPRRTSPWGENGVRLPTVPLFYSGPNLCTCVLMCYPSKNSKSTESDSAIGFWLDRTCQCSWRTVEDNILFKQNTSVHFPWWLRVRVYQCP